VLTEKPIDIIVEGADVLIAETRKAGVKLGVFFQDRSKPDILNKEVRGFRGAGQTADARVK
jgi:predicted dehydrogenase